MTLHDGINNIDIDINAEVPVDVYQMQLVTRFPPWSENGKDIFSTSQGLDVEHPWTTPH